MKILIDARFLGTGTGISCYIENLIKNLMKIDQENDYSIVLENEHFDQFNFKAKNFKKIRINAPYYSLSEQIKLPFLIKKLNPDLVHFASFNHPLIYRGICLFTIHDLILSLFPPKVNIIKKFAYQAAINSVAKKGKKIIVPSHSTKNDLHKLLNIEENKIKVIYDGVNQVKNEGIELNFNYFKNKHKINKKYLLYIGRFASHKNVLGLIDSFSILKNKYKANYQLVLVGGKDKDYFYLKQRTEELKLKKDIIFTGSLNKKELSQVYQNAFVFILPSFYEGFGLPILEAMSYGVPVICSDVSSLPEIAGDAGYFFNPKNINNMAQKINNVLTNGKLRVRLIEKGQKRYKFFSWLKMAEETLLLYKSVIK